MSGDVALVDSGDGAISRLVRTASTLFASPDFRPTALVGGLAVTVRLATVHRATNDVDTVSEGEGPRDLALQYVGDADAAAANRIEIDGVKVDVMATWPLPDTSAELPDDDLDRLFVLGHRWALDTGTALNVDVLDEGATVVESGSLTVATTPALVACKLHAISDRRGSASTKQESDALDLFRLVGDLIRSDKDVDALRTAPFDLAALQRRGSPRATPHHDRPVPSRIASRRVEHSRRSGEPPQIGIQQRGDYVWFVGCTDHSANHGTPATCDQHVEVAVLMKVAPPGLGVGLTHEDHQPIAVGGVLGGCLERVA